MNKKLVYMSARNEDIEENKEFIEKLILELIEDDKRNNREDFVYISPTHCLGFTHEKLSYMDRIDESLAILSKCDELWVCPNYDKEPKSQSVIMEIGFAKAMNIPITYL